ncbi:MAG: hypothetical protein HY815_20665 [Candidatus Riflebacteria bacterium]|nr:hypothetical protein [Candidatus Riflebacteria bacterium]
MFDPISSSRTIDDLVATWSAADPAGWVPRQIRADVSRNRVRDGRELTIRLEALDLFETQYLGDDRGVAPAGGALKVWKVLGDKLLVCCRRAGDARRLQMTIESYERRIGRLRLPGPVAARLLTAIRATARNEQELGAAPATRTTDRAAGSVIPPAPPIRSVGSPSAAAARASPAPSSCPR